MYEYCLGIRPGEPGFGSVNLKPYFDPRHRITDARGHYETDKGRISVSWEYSDGVYTYKADVPGGAGVQFDFPNAEVLSETRDKTLHTFILK